MERTEETTNGMPWGNGNGWGNMSWGNQPFWGYPKQGASGMDVAALVLGIAGTAFGLASGGLGLFNRNNGPNGGNGGPNIMDRIAALEAGVAVNTQRDIDMGRQTELMIENAKQAAKIDVLESEARTTALITAVNNQVITNTGVLGYVEGKVNSLIKIGIPEANVIPTPAATASNG